MITRAQHQRAARAQQRHDAFERSIEARVEAITNAFDHSDLDREGLRAALLQLIHETNDEVLELFVERVSEDAEHDAEREWMQERWEDLRAWWEQWWKGVRRRDGR